MEGGGEHGADTLRAVAFFATTMFTQTFDEAMLPPRLTSSVRLIAKGD
jgi:hypothetical protein